MSEDPSIVVLEEKPQPTTVIFRGESIEVRPLKLDKFPSFLRALQPMLPQIAGAFAAMEAGADSALGVLVVNLIADHGERLYEAVGIAIDKPAAWVGDTDDLGGLVELVTAIVMVHGDFFARQVGPRRAGVLALLRKIVGIGQTLSSSLPPPATA